MYASTEPSYREEPAYVRPDDTMDEDEQELYQNCDAEMYHDMYEHDSDDEDHIMEDDERFADCQKWMKMTTHCHHGMMVNRWTP